MENEIICKFCGSTHVRKYGKYKGVQRYWCKSCKRKFINSILRKLNYEVNQKRTIPEIVYVQPHITEKDNCICFKYIADWMRKRYGNNEFELELANTLEKWSE